MFCLSVHQVFTTESDKVESRYPPVGTNALSNGSPDSYPHHKEGCDTVGNQSNNPTSGVAGFPCLIKFHSTISFQNMLNAFHAMSLGGKINFQASCLLKQLP